MSLSILSGDILSMRSPNVDFDLMALSNKNNILYSTLRIGPGGRYVSVGMGCRPFKGNRRNNGSGSIY